MDWHRKLNPGNTPDGFRRGMSSGVANKNGLWSGEATVSQMSL
jgi:hypothetical protein